MSDHISFDNVYFVAQDGTVIKSPTCPRCGVQPIMVLGHSSQAFCSNDDCQQFTWNPQQTALEVLEDSQPVHIIERDA